MGFHSDHTIFRRVVCLAALVVLTAPAGIAQGGDPEPVSSGRYYGGGALGFTNVARCLPESNDGIGAACYLDCFDGWCDINIVDDVKGPNVIFYVCLASSGCYSRAWLGSASVPGDVIHVVPDATAATTGIVYVR